MALLNNIVNQNPQYKSVMDMINNCSMTPKDLFYKKAEEMGVDPNAILSQLK